ncbi:MAG: transcription termination/antitermination protein NusG [Oscillospiraceae bacterium]|jgi:transcriptional antiterminator NusG|nr:transcription termination/antitermination protein NusG [Oscillospiraceae bacterium]
MHEVKWYVAHTYSGYERTAAGAIEKAVETRKMTELIQEIHIPTEEVTEVGNDGKRATKTRLIYPGYVFIKMVATDPRAWHLVRNIRGVTGFVGENNKPVPLTEDEIRTLGMERKGRVVTKFDIGSKISVTDGPLEGFNGQIIEMSTEKNLVKAIIEMFGRETEVELELDQIELAD